jgi:vitamin B12 transporter
VHSRADALLEFARFNTDNDLPSARIHQVTEAANLGYYISGNTSLRLTLRNDVDATPMASPYGFFGVAPKTKLASQNLYGGFTVETRTAGDWHNLLRYGLVRERAQAFVFQMPATGVPVTIMGANGSTASGTAIFLAVPVREDAITNRDEYGWQTDYRVKSWLNVVGTARYQYERGADLSAATSDRLARGHLSFGGALSGQVRQRFFYEAAGFLDRAADLGLHGGPRVGMTYVPVRPGTRKFRGTSLHATAATGVREPSVVETAQLGTALAPRSRTVDFGIDQNILPKKLELKASYFHGQYAHETEVLALEPLKLSNALGYRAQGLEAEVRYNAAPRLLLVGGYTYLAAVVEQSAATAVFNPNLPGVAIGATTALLGARPFERAPNVGFLAAEYTGAKLAASLKATFAGKSDGTTGLVLNPTLLLPNRDLSPGYGSVDASFSYNMTHAVTLFAQFTNLLDDRHVAPIGYLSTPFGARVGVRVRLGRE